MSGLTLVLFAVLFGVTLWLFVPALLAPRWQKLPDGGGPRSDRAEDLADSLFESLSERI